MPGAPGQSGTTTYGYDAKDRLTSESSTRLGGYAQANAYDAAGNPTTLRGVSQGFDADSRPTGGAYAYDGNGSPTTYRNAPMAYDPEARATQVGSLTAGYRSDGLRAWKASGGATTYFYYDEEGEPVLETDASGDVTAVNVFAPDGLVAREQGGGWTQYGFDPEGGVAQRLDGNGNAFSWSAYDAYGQESSTAEPSDPFGYHARDGYVADRETGLILCGHRYYDPGAGRWLTRDPMGMGGGVNLYGYCQGRPVGWSDPEGLLPRDSVVATCAHYPQFCALLGVELGINAGPLANELGTAAEGAEGEAEGVSDEVIDALARLSQRNFGNLAHNALRHSLDPAEGWNPNEIQCLNGAGRMDAYNRTTQFILEFKPAGGVNDGVAQINRYIGAMGPGHSGQVIYYPAPWNPAAWPLVSGGINH